MDFGQGAVVRTIYTYSYAALGRLTRRLGTRYATQRKDTGMSSTNKHTDDDGNKFADCPKCDGKSIMVGWGWDMCMRCHVKEGARLREEEYRKALRRMIRRRERR